MRRLADLIRGAHPAEKVFLAMALACLAYVVWRFL